MNSRAWDPSPRGFVGLMYLVIVAGLIVGVLAFGEYFVTEHQRISLWDGVFVWLEAGVTLFWATVYFARHAVLGVPLGDQSHSTRRLGLLWFFALLSILGSLAGSTWTTLSLREDEREAFNNSRQTSGTIHYATKVNFKERVAYTLHCSYVDANQVVHSASFLVRDPDELPNMAPGVVQAIRAEQWPVAVTIAYDVDRPKRCWLADLGWRDMTRLYGFLLLVLLFQAMTSVIFLIMLSGAFFSTRTLPWWYDLYAVWLLVAEAAVLLLSGGVVLLCGVPIIWGDL